METKRKDFSFSFAKSVVQILIDACTKYVISGQKWFIVKTFFMIMISCI